MTAGTSQLANEMELYIRQTQESKGQTVTVLKQVGLHGWVLGAARPRCAAVCRRGAGVLLLCGLPVPAAPCDTSAPELLASHACCCPCRATC